eukprot:gene15190-biopygen8057
MTTDGMSNRLLNRGFEETISAGSPLVGLFKNLPPNIPFREAMDQVLLAAPMIPEMDIDTLSVSVEVALYSAEGNMSHPAAAGLTVDEVAAIKMYTMAAEPPTTALYYLLNKALREKNRDNVKPFVKILWLLMHALKKAQPSPSHTVYRGVTLDLSSQYPK